MVEELVLLEQHLHMVQVEVEEQLLLDQMELIQLVEMVELVLHLL